MLRFINDNTIEDEETSITVQVYIDPVPMQDYYPFEDYFVKQDYKGREVIAVWLNEDDNLRDKARTIMNNALEYYIAHNADKI